MPKDEMIKLIEALSFAGYDILKINKKKEKRLLKEEYNGIKS